METEKQEITQGKIHVDLTIDGPNMVRATELEEIQAAAREVFESMMTMAKPMMVIDVRYDYDRGKHVVNIDVVPAWVDWVDGRGRRIHAMINYDRNDHRKLHRARAVLWADDAVTNERTPALLTNLIGLLSYQRVWFFEITEVVDNIEETLGLMLRVFPHNVEFSGKYEGDAFVSAHFTLKYFVKAGYGGGE